MGHVQREQDWFEREFGVKEAAPFAKLKKILTFDQTDQILTVVVGPKKGGLCNVEWFRVRLLCSPSIW